MTVLFRTQVKLPIAPLLDAADATHSRTDGPNPLPNPITALSVAIGKPTATCHRWCRNGVPFHAADEAAIHLGLHPASVWHDAWWDACAEQDRLEDTIADRDVARYLAHRPVQSREQAARVVEYQRVEDARARRRHLTVVA